MHRQRVRASGTGLGGRPSRKPPVARAGGTVSLSGMSRAVRGKPALLGAQSREGIGMSTLDVTSLEDASAGLVDRLERRAARAQPPVDRQQWTFSNFALGAGQRTGQQDSGAEREGMGPRLG